MTEPLSSDQIFISKLTEIVLANLANENFGVKELVQASGMSLYTVSRKLNSVNQKTINQFIREVRLQKAKELLQNTTFSVSEVAYKVGFSSPPYFNTCFREYFGCPPGQVRNNGVESTGHNTINQIIEEQNENKHLRSKFILTFSRVFPLAVLILIVGYFIYPKLLSQDPLVRLKSSGEKASIAVMPLQNLTNDTTLDVWRKVIQQNLISSLSNTGELKVRQKEYTSTVLQSQGLTEYAGISPMIARRISKKLNADIFIYGSIQKEYHSLRVDVQLIDTRTQEVFKSFNVDRPFGEENIFTIVDTISNRVRNFLLISEIIRKENPSFKTYAYAFKSPDVLRYVFYGDKAKGNADYYTARFWYLKALAIDSNSFDANIGLWQTAGTMEESLQILIKLYKKKDYMPPLDQLYTNWAYAVNFEPPGEAIRWLRQIQELDDQNPNIPLLIGNAYKAMDQFDNAIPLYKKAIEMFNKSGIEDNYGYAALGETYHKTGQYKEERKLYKKAGRTNKDHSTISYSWIIRDQATLSLTEGDSVDANRYIKKFISVLKENSSSEADIADGLGWMYRCAGDFGKAEEYYRKALLLEPGNPQRMDILGTFFCYSKRNLNEITGLVDKALGLAKNKWDYYNYLDTKGWGLFKQGNYKEALELFQKIWDSTPFPMYSYKSHLEEVKKAINPQR